MIRIIPAIDLINGSCVRLSKGDYDEVKSYNDNPADQADIFAKAGMKYLHLVDLDGAKARTPQNLNVLRDIRKITQMEIDFSGGLATDKDVRNAFDAGADKITLGSIAVNQKQKVIEWIEEFGPDKIIIGADVLDGDVMTHGWTKNSGVQIKAHIQGYLEYGVKAFMCTDISKDGMLQGPSFELYQDLLDTFPTIHLIASGGVSVIEDIVALDKMGLEAVIVGKAIYEERISLLELQKFMEDVK